jgi:hypothetical protein
MLAVGLIGSTGVANAGVAIPSDVPSLGLFLEENFQLGTMPGQIFGTQNQDDGSKTLMCKSDTEPVCVQDSHIFAIDNLDICNMNSTTSCIQDVWAIDPSGQKIQGSFVKKVQDNPDQYIEENVIPNLPASHGLGAIWAFPGVTNSSGSNQFFVGVEGRYNGDKSVGDPVSKAHINNEGFVAGIVPVKEIPGNYAVLKANDALHGNQAWGSEPVGNTVAPDGTPCTFTDKSFCDVKAQFPSGYRFGMTLNLGFKQSGWFSGRLGDPAISTSNWKGGEQITIEASPTLVPGLDFSVPNSEIPDAAKKLAFNGVQWGRGGSGKKGWQIVGELGDPLMMDFATAFAPAYKNTATSNDTVWSFKTLVSNDAWGATNKCGNSLQSYGGLVTTNSLTYSDGPPSFDPTTGELKYKVASPHYQADGQVAQGSYDLAMRSEVVRCIYGFSNAPIKASISIQSDDGQTQIATTVVNEKNGWLYLAAKGFTFSSPTIAVKLTQDAPVPAATPVATPTPTPSATATPEPTMPPIVKPSPNPSPKKTTITCIKGKITKSVTAVKPTCPAGYKKK